MVASLRDHHGHFIRWIKLILRGHVTTGTAVTWQQLVIDGGERKLNNDPLLHERTPFSHKRIIELLSFCLNATYFSYKGNIYKQKHGAAMGAPVSPNIANLYMDPDSKVHGANMGPIWGRQVCSMLARTQDPGTLLSGEGFETKAMRTALNFQKPRSRGLPQALQHPALHPYVGDTARTLETRLKDHFKQKSQRTAVGDHEHPIKMDNVKVIDREHNMWRRKIRESVDRRSRDFCWGLT